jgi:Na+-transporting NADH:ubiquinone oxidoreductase subunit NqrA
MNIFSLHDKIIGDYSSYIKSFLNIKDERIKEVVEEDLALCEFVCVSKIEIQEIVRQGLMAMIKEMS